MRILPRGCNRCGRKRRRSAFRGLLSMPRRGARTRSVAARSRAAGPAGKAAAGQAEFVADAGGLSEGAHDRAARRAGRKLCEQYRAPLAAIEQQFGVPPTSCWRSGGARPISAAQIDTRNAIRVLGDAGLCRQAQGKIPRRIPAGAENAADGGQARRHAQLLGRRHGAHAIPAVGLFSSTPSISTATAAPTSGIRCRMRWRRRPSNSPTRAGSRGVRWAYEVHPPADVDCTVGVPDTRCRSATGSSAASCRPTAARYRRPSAPSRPRCCSPPALYGPSFLATEKLFRHQGI